MFLTEEELHELTGYKQARKQCDILRRQGVAFFVNACGHPKVVRAVLEGKHPPEPKPEKTWKPKWAVAQA
jgi:hypothetical protein